MCHIVSGLHVGFAIVHAAGINDLSVTFQTVSSSVLFDIFNMNLDE